MKREGHLTQGGEHEASRRDEPRPTKTFIGCAIVLQRAVNQGTGEGAGMTSKDGERTIIGASYSRVIEAVEVFLVIISFAVELIAINSHRSYIYTPEAKG